MYKVSQWRDDEGALLDSIQATVERERTMELSWSLHYVLRHLPPVQPRPQLRLGKGHGGLQVQRHYFLYILKQFTI